jgi:acyl-CoA dehydrogenase
MEGPVDLVLSGEELEVQRRARQFTEQHLIPYEAECEEHEGLSKESLEAIRGQVIEWRFNAINHAPEDGGQGHDLFRQVLIEEQWGRATGALWDVPWRPAIPLREATQEQKERYLRPACRGERRDAYAITEEGAGSDPSMVRTRADRRGGRFVLNGEKWHVTPGDIADFFLVHAHVDGDPQNSTVFFVDKDAPGVRLVRTPKYMHTFVFEHPVFAFEDVDLGPEQILGEVGGGNDLTRDWFVEERLMIGARTVGASARALELSLEFACTRRQFGRPIVEFQGVEFTLADMASELMAAKSLLYRVAWDAARGGLSPRSRSSCARRRPDGSSTAPCRSTGAAATCARTRWSACGESCGWTGYGKGPPRSSAPSSATSSASAGPARSRTGRGVRTARRTRPSSEERPARRRPRIHPALRSAG